MRRKTRTRHESEDSSSQDTHGPPEGFVGVLGFGFEALYKALLGSQSEYTVNPRKLEHGFRRIYARIP